jgi:hypothetical protein
MRRSVFFGEDERRVLKAEGNLASFREVKIKANGQPPGRKSGELRNLSQFSLATVSQGNYLGIRQSRFFRFKRWD